MTSVGDIRAALTAVAERTDHARGHVELAHHHLGEVARIFADLGPSSREPLPREEIELSRRRIEDLRAVLAVALATITDLEARL